MIRRVAALCVLGIRAPFRSRLVAALLVLLALVVVLLPIGVKGDGTPAGDIRMLLTWTLGISFGILAAATLWAGCATVSSDIEDGRHVMTAVSPARPFEIWLGRWLGLVITNALVLLVVISGVALQLKIKGLSSEDTAVSRKLVIDKTSIESEVSSIYRYAVSQGAVPEGSDPVAVQTSIRKDLLTSYLPIDPAQSRQWVFILEKGDADRDLQVEFSYVSSYGSSSGCKGECVVNDDKGEYVASQDVVESDNGIVSFVIPAGVLSGSRFFSVSFTNRADAESGAGVLVRHLESMRVLVPDGGVMRNIVKCGLALLSLLALLAAIGVTCGTMFSFPVATFAATALVFIGIVGRSDLFEEGMELAHSHDEAVGEKSVFTKGMEQFSAALSTGVTFTTESFSDTEAIDRLGDGMAIEAKAVAKSVFYTGIILPLLFGLLAALALRRREL